MRDSIGRFVKTSLSFVIVLVGASLAATQAGATTYTYSSYLSASAPANIGIQAFMDQVQKETKDEIKFNLYGSGTLSTGKTTISAIQNGLVDGGMITSVYTPSTLPVNMVLSDLLFFNEDARVTSAALADTVLHDCPDCLKEFEKLNIHFLAPIATSPYYMMCARSFPDGFSPKGLRVRVPGEELGRWIKTIGGAPIAIANSEAYQALQRNTLDCAMGSKVWLRTLSWQEVMKTVVDLPMGGYQGGALVNISQKDWQKLDKKTQDIFSKAAMYGMAAGVYAYDATAEIATAKKKYHVQFIDPPAKLVSERKAFLQSEIQVTIQKAEKRGVKNPQAIIDAFQKNMKKWEALIGNKEMTQKQYAEILIANIL